MKKVLLIILLSVFCLFFSEAQALNVTATNGSAVGIQEAVDQVAAAGYGNVFIPEGTFNFVEVGEPWTTVTIPAGVNIFGAPTERDANDQAEYRPNWP